MHIKYGKVQFNRKDTFSLDSTLSPIIAQGLKKFKEVIKDHPFAGVPSSITTKLYPDNNYGYNDKEIEDAFVVWIETLDKMIYAFDSKEPVHEDFNLKFGKTWRDLVHITSTDESVEETEQRFKNAKEKHYEDVKIGLALFAEHYNSLWW